MTETTIEQTPSMAYCLRVNPSVILKGFFMQPLIRVDDLHHIYQDSGGKDIPAINGIDMVIQEGEFLSIIGANGSGKSTLARHFNALLEPTHGNVFVNGVNIRDPSSRKDLHRRITMVFQHPESQAVATTVEEDVAFGPENLGVPPKEIRQRVDWALDIVGLSGMQKRAPHYLSGGQKQRLALAGALAMHPQCIILDEATSMLDPSGKRGFREIINQLHSEGVTIVMITQDMNEVILSDRVIVLSHGCIMRDGPVRYVMTDTEFLQTMSLDVPTITQVAHKLHDRWVDFPGNLLYETEIVDQIARLVQKKNMDTGNLPGINTQERDLNQTSKFIDQEFTEKKMVYPVIDANDLWYTYLRGTPLETVALRGVNFDVYPGEIVGLIGATGSGKSTLLQHLDGLLTPQHGKIMVKNQDISDKQCDMRALRQQIALLFQHPEDQLFEQYIADDVAYGPINLGLPREEVRQRVNTAMEATGLPLETFRDRTIYSLSGGERRRAALAGVLALEPEVLVLDEATAGLDPRGRRELLGLLHTWQEKGSRSIVWASHSMEEISQLAGRVTVLSDGQNVMSGTPHEIFRKPESLSTIGLDVPIIVQIMNMLAGSGLPVPKDVLTVDEVMPIFEKLFVKV